jgi:hypothetical protein
MGTLGSQYLIEESKLRIVFGPLHLTYPLEKLVLVRKGGLWAQMNPANARLAFSRDNIIIETLIRWIVAYHHHSPQSI